MYTQSINHCLVGTWGVAFPTCVIEVSGKAKPKKRSIKERNNKEQVHGISHETQLHYTCYA